ncbi:hypothetical protein Tco_0062941, partial [Tanacetum coccineum]
SQQIKQVVRETVHLSNSSSGVPNNVKGINPLTDSVTHTRHLSNATSIVTDGTISIYSQSYGNGAKHSKSSYCNTVHGSKAETHKDADSYGKNRNDDRFVS